MQPYSALNSRRLVEVVGFIGRIISSRESPNWTLGPYIIQSILLLIAPVSRPAEVFERVLLGY